MIRSTELCEISRSCHRPIFSNAAIMLERTIRARPLICSHVTGLRLCGMAELPRCSSPNGSSASRTSVRKAEEPFGDEQRGSSAMPHKRNPVTCEQISGLARIVRSNMIAAFENIGLWHERDISHSSVERVILPDSTILVDYMLAKMTAIVAEMRVFPERMKKNLELTQGLVFSGQLLQDLVEKGMPRDEAYKTVQENAMAAWEKDASFQERVGKD